MVTSRSKVREVVVYLKNKSKSILERQILGAEVKEVNVISFLSVDGVDGGALLLTLIKGGGDDIHYVSTFLFFYTNLK